MNDQAVSDQEDRRTFVKQGRRATVVILLLVPAVTMALSVACISLAVAAAVQTFHDPDTKTGFLLGVFAFLFGIGACAGIPASIQMVEGVLPDPDDGEDAA